jgi:hypothetical protein
MADVNKIDAPALAGKRRAFVLAEERIGHYPEFRAFFSRTFDLDRQGLAEPGYVSSPSGLIYVLVFIGRSGEPFPVGIEIYALPDALEPLDDAAVDRDLWAILRWMIAGVGGEWTDEKLEQTGLLLRIPAALDGSVRRD